MEIELAEIRDFLTAHPPFDQLPNEALDPLIGEILVRYLRRDTAIPEKADQARHLYFVRKGALRVMDAEGKLREQLGEGDYFIPNCGMENATPLQGRTEEDSLVYLVPCDLLERLRQYSADFDAFFSAGTNERLRQALAGITDTDELSSNSLINIKVRNLIEPRVVEVNVDTSVLQAAQTMTEHGVSSLLVTDKGALVGILTDKDLRRRFICESLPYNTPIHHIMTREPNTISPDTLGFEALLKMTRLGIHHLPVLERGRVLGLISTTDLIRFQSVHGPYLVRGIMRAETVDELSAAAQHLPRLQVQMVNSGATANHIGQVVSSVTDAITQRLILLAEQELGPAPIAYVWVTGGSQARREQTSHSDQDNALILANGCTEAHRAYFAQLARFVSDGLNACGFVYCPGNAMATNPQWCQPLSTWQGYFDTWIERPEPMALMLSSIFFDLRPVHGEESLFSQLQQHMLNKSQQNKIFLAYMAANALKHRPPMGFFRTFVLISDGEHDNTFDIKHRGTVPIIDLARVYALSCGSPAINTLERLEDAARQGALSQEGAENLTDALEFIATLRIRHQAEQLKQGLAADNYLPPNDLSPLERNHLKDAFKAITTMQEALDARYQASRFF